MISFFLPRFSAAARQTRSSGRLLVTYCIKVSATFALLCSQLPFTERQKILIYAGAGLLLHRS